MTLVAAATWACSDDDHAPPAPAGSGGTAQGGTGGKGGMGGKSSSAGLGGGDASGDAGASGASCESVESCPLVDACGPYPLAELCSAEPSACPTLDELDSQQLCGMDSTLTMRELSCGGQVVSYVSFAGLVTETWGFDADGTLVYREMGADGIERCRDGKTASGTATWGELPCREGVTTIICGEGGAGGQGGAQR